MVNYGKVTKILFTLCHENDVFPCFTWSVITNFTLSDSWHQGISVIIMLAELRFLEVCNLLLLGKVPWCVLYSVSSWSFHFFFSIALLKFASRGDDQFVLVGVARDLVLNPRSLTGGFLYLYQLEDGGESLKLLHKTPVEDVPGAIASFQGRVLIGVGRYLRIYDIGKKKMLRKCENKVSYYVFRKKNWANYQCECIIMKILMQFYSWTFF